MPDCSELGAALPPGDALAGIDASPGKTIAGIFRRGLISTATP
jgi:hypothetical protein